MSASTGVRTDSVRIARRNRVAGCLLIVSGIAFVAGGATHPGDSGTGSRVTQLYEMQVDSMWYPSHALLLVATASFALALFALRRRLNTGTAMSKVTGAVLLISVVATVGMAVHLADALGAQGIADGEQTFLYRVQVWNETIIDPLWSLGIGTLAAVGGLTRNLGNAVTLVIGVVGALAFAIASATIAFTERYDGLFAVGALLGVWAVLVGLLALVRADSPVARR